MIVCVHGCVMYVLEKKSLYFCVASCTYDMICFSRYQGEVIHLRILQDEATKFFLNNDELFSSIDALIQHYKRNELNMVHRTSFKLLAPVTQSRDCSQPRSQSQPVINRVSFI